MNDEPPQIVPDSGYLHVHIDGCWLTDDPKRALLRTIGRGTRELTIPLCPRPTRMR
jgi:hypothetical protein